jgi:hypothetical protein
VNAKESKDTDEQPFHKAGGIIQIRIAFTIGRVRVRIVFDEAGVARGVTFPAGCDDVTRVHRGTGIGHGTNIVRAVTV